MFPWCLLMLLWLTPKGNITPLKSSMFFYPTVQHICLPLLAALADQSSLVDVKCIATDFTDKTVKYIEVYLPVIGLINIV